MTAILSDIHGNLPALESVFNDIEKYKVDKVISLGDVSGYYPFINEVIELLRSHNTMNLIGNHDRYIIDNTECPRSTSANFCLTYQKSVITEENRIWLKNSSPSISINDASYVHGGWDDPEDEYLYKISASYFERFNEKFFFCGHTHVQKYIDLKNGQFFINPGSVGQPRDGTNSAAYCLFDEKNQSIILKRINYNIDKVANKMKELNFDEYYYSNLYKGTRIGGNIDSIEFV